MTPHPRRTKEERYFTEATILRTVINHRSVTCTEIRRHFPEDFHRPWVAATLASLVQRKLLTVTGTRRSAKYELPAAKAAEVNARLAKLTAPGA